MNKKDVFHLRNYIQVDMTNHGHTLELYFTNGNHYNTQHSQVMQATSLAPTDVASIKALMASPHKQEVKIIDKKVALAASYVMMLSDLFMAAEQKEYHPRYAKTDEQVFDDFNNALSQKKEVHKFMDDSYGIKWLDEEFYALYNNSIKFKLLPQAQQTEALALVQSVCKAIDATKNQSASKGL